METDLLNQDLDRRAAEIEVLRRASLEINTTLDLKEIFDIVLRTMDELFDFHHSIILLPSDAPDELRVVASRGHEDQALGGTLRFGTGVIGMVAKRRKLMRVSNLGQQRAYAATIRGRLEETGRTDELEDVVPVPGLPEAESQLAIPLVIKDTLVGVFSVESPEQKPFSDHDELLVTIVANQAASAIQNASLYAAAVRRRAELAEAHESLKQLNETLEDRVRARTEELQQTNLDLRETQAQLVQSDKMASLGMLAAGVAHEINTPLGAIHSNNDIESRALEIIRDTVGDPAIEQLLGEHPKLHRALEAIKSTNSVTQQATERVTVIVESLKNFARLDQAELQLVDLHEGIDSTLTLLQHLVVDRIEIVRNYGTLPEVECYASQINQVFMNILTNAIQAIDDAGSIEVTTRSDGDQVVVDIADSGRGIPSEQLEHVFDPGFTTKGVGVGVGLGLSITYRIIEDHRGSIDVDSESGNGTTFTVRLPVSHTH